MKVKNGFNLREVCGEHIIVAEGDENIDFSNIISMNESSAYLWEEVQQVLWHPCEPYPRQFHIDRRLTLRGYLL